MADLFAELLEEVRAEREARRRRFPGMPLFPGPSSGDDALAVVKKLCDRVEQMEGRSTMRPEHRKGRPDRDG